MDEPPPPPPRLTSDGSYARTATPKKHLDMLNYVMKHVCSAQPPLLQLKKMKGVQQH